MQAPKRRSTVPVRIRQVTVGGGHPVVVQSMTNTDTADVEATVRQVTDLARAGSELVRLTVNNEAAARAVPAVVEQLQAGGTAFMGIFTEASDGPTGRALILAHGMGAHPDWPDIINPLRSDLIEAARQLDETMTDIKDSGRLMSLERIALQAALNYSAELIALRRLEDRRQESIDSRIRTLADRLDDALKD